MGALKTVVAIDPGVRKLGVAIFSGETGDLLHARTVVGLTPPDAVDAVLQVVEDWTSGFSRGGVSWVIEKMVEYADRSQTHADLERVEDTVRLLVKEAKRRRLCKGVKRVTPASWKGAVPKIVCGHRVLKVLNELERTRLRDQSHDTLDAVGIGLVYLNRAARGLVVNNPTGGERAGLL